MKSESVRTMLEDSEVQIVNHQYGKDFVRLLHLRRDGDQHHIKEVEVNTRLRLSNMEQYKSRDNSQLIATDSQNMVYIMAKENGIRTIEMFAQQLCQNLLDKYAHVDEISIYVEEKPWKRIEMGSKQHIHGFIATADGTKYCKVEQRRRGVPQLWVGIKDMKVMKTAMSSFENFVSDEYRTLPDSKDRIFCTVMQAEWCYNSTVGMDYEMVWSTVRESILHIFAGPPDKGLASPSVQKTLYDACRLVLGKVPQIEDIKIVLPNVHAYKFDIGKFPSFGFNKTGEVFQPADKPSGNIQATVRRRLQANL